jgi:hypothetical protein
VQLLVCILGNLRPTGAGGKDNYAAHKQAEDSMSSRHQDPLERNVQHKPKQTHEDHDAHVGTAALGCPAERSSAAASAIELAPRKSIVSAAPRGYDGEAFVGDD